MSGWVAANRQVMINSEASLDLGEQAHSGMPLKHALSVPLITRESLVGTDYVVLGDDLHREPEPARPGDCAASRAGGLGREAQRRGGARIAPQGARAAGAANSDLRLVSTR